MFHSDHDSVYTSMAYAQLCTDLGVRQSTGTIGNIAPNVYEAAASATRTEAA